MIEAHKGHASSQASPIKPNQTIQQGWLSVSTGNLPWIPGEGPTPREAGDRGTYSRGGKPWSSPWGAEEMREGAQGSRDMRKYSGEAGRRCRGTLGQREPGPSML